MLPPERFCTTKTLTGHWLSTRALQIASSFASIHRVMATSQSRYTCTYWMKARRPMCLPSLIPSWQAERKWMPA